MIIRFKSSECKEGEVEKTFNKDFKSSVFSEKEYSCLKEGVTGTLKEIQLNHLFILFQEYTNKDLEAQLLEVVQDQSLLLLQFVIEGEVRISSDKKDSKTHTLLKNSYNLYHIPASSYSLNYPKHKKQVLNIFFTESFLKEKVGSNYIKNSKKYLEAKEKNQFYSFFDKGLSLNSQIRNIINEFLNCSFNEVMRKSYIEAKITELLVTVLASDYSVTCNNNIKNADKESLIKIENYIRTHLKEDLSIEKLSILAGFNTSKFKSEFKKVYKMPVFQYITALRIEKATQLILKEEYTIAQASYEVGYKNPQHFTVAFKKKLGYLPSELIN
ncbi:transcriptional regulator, AraC family protein [unidentified eubacterium SCB49]|nr:transcriptional regulator, AraC family protein [unidentified eubacterium SCB49]